jgi:hypothetical protein
MSTPRHPFYLSVAEAADIVNGTLPDDVADRLRRQMRVYHGVSVVSAVSAEEADVAGQLLRIVDEPDAADVEIARCALFCDCGLDRGEGGDDDGEHDDTCPAFYRDDVARLLSAARREGVRP